MFASTKPEKSHFLDENETGEVVGFGDCGAAHEVNTYAPSEIYTLYVLRLAQAKGLGKKLFAIMRDHLAKNFDKVELKTHADNSPAKEFYHYMGGQNVGEIKSADWNETVYFWPTITG